MRRHYFYLSAFALAAGSLAARADFSPIRLAPESFNQDVVVEKEAIHAPISTSASMDDGLANTGFGWYEMGYNLNSTDTGLPAAGSSVTSLVADDHSYTFAPDYSANNALLIDTNIPSATLTLTTPSALAGISFLTAAGHGPVTNAVVVHYANGSTETNNFVSPDWFGSNAAVAANGRIDVVSMGFDAVGSGNPNLYSVDVPLAVSGSAVSSIEVRNGATGNSHTAVFAVSGAATAGGAFTPLAVTGFNRDLVVEANAPQPLTSVNATTASVDAGLGNTGFSWYERGYNTNFPATGLPIDGSTLTNISAPDHVYVLPASYTQNNAVLVDGENNGTIRFATPAKFSSLSFLTSAGNGAVTVSYTVNHEDGTTENGTFLSPDWFDSTGPAFTSNGRVDVATGLFANMNSGFPRLYPADIVQISTNSPITTVDLTLSEGTGHAVIFAVSGALGNVAPLIANQPASITVLEGSPVQLTATTSGTLPFTYAWQIGTNDTFVNLQNGSNVSGVDMGTLSIDSAALTNGALYRLAVTNVAGSTFSLPVTVTVRSALPSILSPSDTITLFGGTTPENETVDHAIDQNTQKYLNFGTTNVPPYTGPQGFIITPTLGSDAVGTIVNALRIYTANDFPERDPASFVLEGSNDGTNFTQIVLGNLSLPDARNAAGATIDPLTQALQEVHFANSTPYKSYRVLFPHVKNDTTANSVQVAEVELLGTVATAGTGATLTISGGDSGSLTITSSVPGSLQSTTAFASNGTTTWTDEGSISGSRTISATGDAKFFRVLVGQ